MAKKKKIIIIAVICVIVIAAVIGTVVPITLNKKNEQKNTDYYTTKMENFQKENKKLKPGSVVFLGDSITDFCDLSKFYPGLNAVNRGIAGDITTGILGRLKESVYDIKPSAVVLLIGINDISIGRMPDEIITNIRSIVKEIHRVCPNTKIIVQSVYPVNEHWTKPISDHHNPLVQEINSALERDAAEYSYTFANTSEVLIDDNKTLIAEYSYDGLHLSDKGYEAVAACLRPVIDSALA